MGLCRERDCWCCVCSEAIYWKIRTKNKKLFFYLLTWKRRLIGCHGKLFVLLWGRRVSQNAVEGKGLKVNVDKTKGMQLLFEKKSSVSNLDTCGVCGVVVILFSVRNIKVLFIVVVLMCLGSWVYYYVEMSFSVEHVLVMIVQ